MQVPVNAGDVILWRSDLCHCGVGPRKDNCVSTFRAVSYTCMLPAVLTDQSEVGQPFANVPASNSDINSSRAEEQEQEVLVQQPQGGGAAVTPTPAVTVRLLGTETMFTRKTAEYMAMLTGDHRPDLPSMPHMQVLE